jgi:thiol-disulfide isomerase/thioredoxin
MLTTLLLLSNVVLSRGEPFADLGLEPALEQAKAAKKLLLVDFTATWCGPCKKMDKETWSAAEVRAFLAESALAIQVDVDEERELAQRFRIEALPTVVALRDGAEFDRVVGFKDAGAFLAWARDVRAGKRASDALLARSKELSQGTDVRVRYDLAKELVGAGLHDEALAHFLWLWPATRTVPGFKGVRLSFMLSDMAGLAQKHAPAKAAFEEILAALQAKVDAAPVPGFEDWQEWTALCKSFGWSTRVVEWYERRRDESGRLPGTEDDPRAEAVVSEVFDALLQAERPLDAVRLYADARRRAEGLVRQFERSLPSHGIDEGSRERLAGYLREKLLQDLSKLYGALLSAERRDEAEGVAQILLRAIDTAEARATLVRQALRSAKRSDPSFARWLDEAAAAGLDVQSLRRRLGRLERGEDAEGD